MPKVLQHRIYLDSFTETRVPIKGRRRFFSPFRSLRLPNTRPGSINIAVGTSDKWIHDAHRLSNIMADEKHSSPQILHGTVNGYI